MNVQALLHQAKQAGLQIRADAGQVKLAGPSELIQKWRPLLAPHKAELLALLAANDGTSIPVDLETLIQESARFWRWDDDDMRLIRETAARDSEGIRLALATNPLRSLYSRGTVNDTRLGSKV
ncbi:MAG: hypothetical protein IPG66_11805 [Hydrogenophilales bacterium]|nr:hypothetical protein [Hydrogenophilales bacterium]